MKELIQRFKEEDRGSTEKPPEFDGLGTGVNLQAGDTQEISFSGDLAREASDIIRHRSAGLCRPVRPSGGTRCRGMRRVLKAFDRRMHRVVAIKRLKTPGTVDSDLPLRLGCGARLYCRRRDGESSRDPL